MNTRWKNTIGISALYLGLFGFFFWMQVLGIFGSPIEYTNLNYVLRMSVPWIFTFGCAYYGLRLLQGPETARRVVLNIALPLVVAFFIGMLLHGDFS